MKTKEKTKRTEIAKIRDIRDKVSHDIQSMDFKQLAEYLNSRKPLHPAISKKHHK